MNGLTEHTKSELRKAGWTPSRCIDITSFMSALSEAGSPASEHAVSFLRSFGGIRMTVPHRIVRNDSEWIEFDPSNAVRMYDLGWVRDFEASLGVRLSVVGLISDGNMLLLLADDGAMYASVDSYLVRLGETEASSLNAIVEGEPPPVVVEYDAIPIVQRFASEPEVLGEIAQSVLSRIGWQPDRHVDVSEWQRACEQHGLEPLEPAIRFLFEFNGIVFPLRGVGVSSYDNSPIVYYAFGGIGAFQDFPADYLIKYKQRVNSDLIPIARTTDAPEFLMMADDGRVYLGKAVSADLLWLVGKSGYDALNGMIDRRPVIWVPF
jgi:hypothetical protein